MNQAAHLSGNFLKAKAREITGIDVDDQEADAALTVLCNAYRHDSNLHASGTVAISNYLLRLLSNRLRMQRDFINHPEIAEEEITSPVFLWGMPRTGSTKAQKLLAASGDFNFLTFWESHNPALYTSDRGESPESRIRDTDEFAQWFREASPGTLHTHPLQTHEPEEETFILMHSLRTPCFIAFSDTTSYLQWLATQDMTAQFAYLKDTLKYLQWQGLASAAKPWLLKSPVSYGMESAVLSVFPDAKLVMTHRDPREVIPSFCSTIKSYYTPFTDAPINYETKIGQLVWALNLHLAARSAANKPEILDVNYAELVNSVEGVVEKIYAFAGLPLTPSSRSAIVDWNQRDLKNGKAAHKYLLKDFGVSEKMIAEQFADYDALLRHLFGNPTEIPR